MRFKATILLSLVLIALGGYLYFVEIPGEKKKQEAEIEEKRLYGFSQTAVTNLSIQTRNGASIDFLHEPADPDNPWRITHPVEAIANEAAASSLASQVERLQASRMIEEKAEDLKEFGLDPPIYTVIVTLNRVDTEILEVGSENLTGSEVYVRKGAGTPVYLAPASIKQALNKELKDWRRQELFRFASTDVKRVQIESPHQQIEITREEEGWQIRWPSERSGHQKPIQAKGDPNEISNLLGSLSSLRGDDFIDTRKADWLKGLGEPILKLTLLVGALEHPAVFYKAPFEPDAVYAVTTPAAPIYKLSEREFKILEEPASSYRDRRVVDLVDPVLIEQISIKKGGESVFLERKEGEWWMKKGETSKKVDSTGINGLLFELNELRVDRFPEPAPPPAKAGLSNPEWSVQLKGKEGKSLGQVSFGRIEGDLAYVQSSNQPGPVLLKKEEVDRAQKARDEIKPSEAPVTPPAPPASPAGSIEPKKG
ncbi:MAG: DUF4340 domain-containing protein [Candidatus Manganitrophus sp.]|nr:MAG: DUF4340 domain-containing protein [Candidatus Manganitrophus sp.]